MVSIKWCLKQKSGLEVIKPNNLMADSYLKMAEESVSVLHKVEGSRIWQATASYYIFYYSLYALMVRLGFKCEIHSCSMEFMKQYLGEAYSARDMDMIHKSFQARIDLQYFADRPVDEEVIAIVTRYCREFFIKTKDFLAMLTEAKIQQLRKRFESEHTQRK